MVTQCQEIIKNTRQQCRNKVYSVTEIPPIDSPTGDRLDLHLCRLHFSFSLNEPKFRGFRTWPIKTEDVGNMQLLYDLHDRSKP